LRKLQRKGDGEMIINIQEIINSKVKEKAAKFSD